MLFADEMVQFKEETKDVFLLFFFLSVLTVLSVLICISINVNNIVYSCKICHVNVNNKGSASQCDICQSWVHESVKCNQLNHID